MDALLKKLNFAGQDPVVVVNAPAEFDPIVSQLSKAATVHTRQ